MEQITRFQGIPCDIVEAVAARVARSRFLYEGGHVYVVLLEESVLRYRTAGPEAMRGQLHHLLAAPANRRPPKRVKPTVTAPGCADIPRV
jgi:hypothetical protein